MRRILTSAILLGLVAFTRGSLFAQDNKGQSTDKPTVARDSTKKASKPSADKSGSSKKTAETKPAEDTKKDEPAGQLTKGSIWRGNRWRGQANSIEGPQPSNDIKITVRDGNQVTLTGHKWAGALGMVHWTFTINGKQLTCTSITFTGGGPTGTFEEVSGTGTIEGDVLRFEVAAHQKSPNFNGPVYEKMELKLAK
jgi:hypothetical protein